MVLLNKITITLFLVTLFLVIVVAITGYMALHETTICKEHGIVVSGYMMPKEDNSILYYPCINEGTIKNNFTTTTTWIRD